jgi:NADPH:quinone reductase
MDRYVGAVHAATIVGGRLEWTEQPDPEPTAGEVLVRVRAAGLNGADRLQVAGLYPAPPDAPVDIPGLELAGEVVATGAGVTRWSPDDRVMAVVGGGGQAQLAVVHERHLLAVPDGVGWPEAGGFPEVFTTAHDALFTQCGLAMGERVLIHGAAGGVGVAGVQLAAAAGCSVVATVRDESKRSAVEALAPGVTAITPEGFEDHGPFDVVLELVGAPNLPGDVASLAGGGRIAVIGVGAGADARVPLLALMGARGRIHGSTLRTRSLEDKAGAARAVERHVLPLLAAGRIRVPVDCTVPMSEAADAYERFAAGGKLGKIVLVN